MDKFPMTPEGEEKLRKELEQRKSFDRPKITQAIAEARELGDLKENAEYHAAREEQGFNEACISDMENKLNRAQVIDIKKIKHQNRVVFSSTVTLKNLENDQLITYQIVGEDESDIKLKKISVTSPLARAIIGKEIGDIASISTANGLVEYEINKIEFI
ncbi:MAG: transcription elongation factor GreA [Endozoicomonadaceae bacterium]|nr:transcription elongation factor GreA [Endozoicomonadaceae bacterium]MBE8232280.1 transcription elongation factor GreA [Endozoicomonadaceae bacterium]